MKRSTAIIIGVVAIVVVVAAALLLPGLLFPPPKEKTFTLDMLEFGFNQVRGGPTLRVKVGDKVTIILRNKGGIEHEFMVLTREDYEQFLKDFEAGKHPKHPEPAFVGAIAEDMEPGETRTITFVADKAGSFVYVCLVEEPDLHAKLGMIADFIVEP